MKEDRQAFKNRMRSLRTYREQNPGKGYWEWRNSLPDNLKYTDDSEYDMKAAYESGAGGEVLPTRGITVTNAYGDKTHYIATSMDDDGTLNLSLPDIEITPRNNLNLAGSVSKAMDNVARSGVNMATYVTPLGDVEDAYNIAKDINIGNYGQAALGIGLMALPNFIEKPLRRAGKLLKKSKKVIDELSLDDVKNWTDTDWDFNYNQAIKNNDTKKIQKLRDLHFKVKAPNTVFEGPYYHGSGKSFNIFDPAKIGNTDKGWLGRGYYFTPSEDYAKMYGNTKKFYLNASNPIEGKGIAWFNREDINPILLRNPNIREAVERGRLADAARGSMPQTKPYDGYFEEDVMKYNTQMKLADPITYDDSGDIIPLSKRDNFSNPDIRYGLIPLIGFSTLNYNNGESTQKYKDGGEVEPPYPQFVNGQRVNRWTGQPIATGQATPVLDLRTAADFTPVGDALAVNDAYQAIKNRDWLGASLSALAVAPFIPTVNKRYVQDAIDRALSRNTKNIQKATDLNNETYEVIQRLTDDPSYMNRANSVKEKYGDDYTQIYADLIDAYNTNPDILPKAMPTEFSTGANGRMSTTKKSTERHRQGGEFPKLGEYEYQFVKDTNLPEGITVHETNHLSDFLKNKTSDADGNSNLFYQMRQSIKPYADGNNKYYGNMSEQKAYMNQLREYMYNRGLINNRDQQVDRELLQNTIDKLPSDMNSVKRASKQFKSMRQYVKWFNTIPLLGAGAVAANRYYTQQENK